jgi:histo-blood group ABO system transferase
MRVVLNVIATNKYTFFLNGLITSAEQNFLPGVEKTYIIHTNVPLDIQGDLVGKVIVNHIEHESWPGPTIKRFHYFLMQEDAIASSDYCFYVDVDSLFVREISGSDVLPLNGMAGTLHTSFYGNGGTPERNPASRACIPHGSDNKYFFGGFFGGDSESFIETCKELRASIDEDFSNDIVAVWHDESHLNRFFFENPPARIFDNYMAVPEEFPLDQYTNARLIFLQKGKYGGHDYFRS